MQEATTATQEKNFKESERKRRIKETQQLRRDALAMRHKTRENIPPPNPKNLDKVLLWEVTERRRIAADAAKREQLLYKEISQVKAVEIYKIKKMQDRLDVQLALEREAHEKMLVLDRKEAEGQRDADRRRQDRMAARQKQILELALPGPLSVPETKKSPLFIFKPEEIIDQKNYSKNSKSKKMILTQTQLLLLDTAAFTIQRYWCTYQWNKVNDFVVTMQCAIRQFLARKRLLRLIMKHINEAESNAAYLINTGIKKYLDTKRENIRVLHVGILRNALRKRAEIVARNNTRKWRSNELSPNNYTS